MQAPADDNPERRGAKGAQMAIRSSLRGQALLTHAQQHRTIGLPPLMELEEPPPVPPKDSPYRTRMDSERPTIEPASGSKRKRESHDEATYDSRRQWLDVSDADTHTPKRSRSRLSQSEGDASDDATPKNQQSVRRKKGSRNLSHLNLRHAAQQQTLPSPNRESRFQEGSLTDKPSEKPPSLFTRIPHSESRDLEHVEELMTDYHDIVEGTNLQSRDLLVYDGPSRDNEGTGLLRFGRSFAANFHPVALWNRMWNETKEELTRQNAEEAERKAKQKAEAEAKYAIMKSEGHFGFSIAGGTIQTPTPRDSAIVLDSGRSSKEHSRISSYGSHLAPLQDEMTSVSGAELPETAHRTLRAIKSRLRLKRPSLSNLQNNLKRVRSDFSLAAAVNRESSSSLSPTKADFPDAGLPQSHSKYDMKKQQRLSKRISDLEVKLQKARQELDVALVEASPGPKLGNKFERFASTNASKRPRFVPGALPTLPSERLLFPERLYDGDEGESTDPDLFPESEPRAALDLSELDGDETVKARDRPYPARATSLFKPDYENNEAAMLIVGKDNKSITDNTIEITAEMDPNSLNMPNAGMKELGEEVRYDSLDAKLKALDASVVASQQPKSHKKRSAAVSRDDKVFKPEDEPDDDAEWQEAAPKKKRKSGSKAQSGSTSKRQSSPRHKRKQKSEKKAVEAKGTFADEASRTVKSSRETSVPEETNELSKVDIARDNVAGQFDADAGSVRTSLDSQGIALEPLYEEEEETTVVPLKDAPSRPTAKSTPARYGRNDVRSRSKSPFKQTNNHNQPAAEEKLITRAAEAAQNGRHSHSKVVVTVDTPNASVSVPEDMEEEAGEPQQVNFEWPDDVF